MSSKRPWVSASEDQPPAGSGEGPSKKQRPMGNSWCADCWSLAGAACRGPPHRHRLVDALVSMQELRADVAAKHKALQALVAAREAELEQLGERLAALEKAFLAAAPVLEAVVDEVEGENNLVIDKVDLRITLAVTEALTDKDKRRICKALEGATLSFEMEGRDGGGDVSVSSGPVTISQNRDLAADIMGKFVDRTLGQRLGKGAILLCRNEDGSMECLQLYRDGVEPNEGSSNDKVFGWLDAAANESLDPTIECDDRECDDPDCICHEGVDAETTLSQVVFSA